MSKQKNTSSSSSSSKGNKKQQHRQEEEDDDEDDDLLPDEISPLHYGLFLQPNYTDWTFSGRVVILLRIDEETDEIQFNAAELDLKHVTLLTASQGALTPTRIHHDEEEEVTTLRFDEPLRKGEATLEIQYTGKINDHFNGFYRTQYQHEHQTQTILVTQFEPCDARRALPCWDEPARKSTFTVTLRIPQTFTALSNMPMSGSRPAQDMQGWLDVSFQTTPIMSSYLLAWAIGEFESVQTTTSDGKIIVRVLTPKGKISQAQFGLDCGRRCVEMYAQYFDLPYPLPKLDLLAIPDIAIEAMENWGLITFAEAGLLIHPTESSLAGKQYAAILICHEIAHQWFGNIVTMEWWTDLWLNEGFATWCQYMAVDVLYPSWNIWSLFQNERFTYSLSVDALVHSHPVEVEIDDPSAIDEAFDAISYSKGSVIIRMLHTYLGDNQFRIGLSKYLKHYAYKNACTKDLWNELSLSSGNDVVTKMMSLWCLQQGFPIISVKSIKLGAGGKSVVIELSQKKFMINGGAENKDQTKWTVPINIGLPGHASAAPVQSAIQLLTDHAGKLDFSVPSGGAALDAHTPLIKLNPGQVYLYRVLYPATYYPLLKASLFSFSPADRLGIQNDLFALSRASMSTFQFVAEFVEAYREETDTPVWLDLITNLLDVKTLLYQSQDELYKKYCQWIVYLCQTAFQKIGGWNVPTHGGEDPYSTLRGKLIYMLVLHGDQDTIQQACQRFHLFLVNEGKNAQGGGGGFVIPGPQTAAAPVGYMGGSSFQQPAPFTQSAPGGPPLSQQSSSSSSTSYLPPDLREAVYAAVVMYGGQLGFEMLLTRFHTLSDTNGSREEIIRCLHALGYTTDRTLLQRALNLAINDPLNHVRVEDATGLLCNIGNNKYGLSLFWDFLKQNWEHVFELFEGAFSLPRLIGILGNFTSEAIGLDIQSFFKKHDVSGAERAVKQTIEKIVSNTKYLQREEKKIQTWLGNRIQQIKVAAAAASSASSSSSSSSSSSRR